MSISLLLALLESSDATEPDYSKEYHAWIGAQWNGKEWTNGSLERRELVLRELYDALQATISVTMPASVALGTILARTLSEDQRPGLPEAAMRLRAMLRPELLKRLDALRERYGPSRSRYQSPALWQPQQEQEKIQQLQETVDALTKTIAILASKSN